MPPRAAVSLLLMLLVPAPVPAQDHPAASHAPKQQEGGARGAPTKVPDAGRERAAATKATTHATGNDHGQSSAGHDRLETGDKPATKPPLEEVLQRINARIAARATRTGTPSSGAAAGRSVASRADREQSVGNRGTAEVEHTSAHIKLEWRPSVVWPTGLKPTPVPPSDGQTSVTWSAIPAAAPAAPPTTLP